MTFDADEILHIRQPNPQTFLFGFSPTEAAAYMIDVNSAQNKYFRNFYEKDATPDGLITAPEGVELDANTRNEFLEQWVKFYGGPEKKRRVGFLDRGMKYEKMMVTAAEMQAAETSNNVRDAIFGHFRVPLSKAGMSEKIVATTTYNAMNYGFYLDVIDPLVGNIEDQIKLDLMSVWFDEKIEVGHDNMVPQDDERQSTIDKIDIESGKRTRNEIRHREGLPDVVGGDEIIITGRPTILSALVEDPAMFATGPTAAADTTPAPAGTPAADEPPQEAQ